MLSTPHHCNSMKAEFGITDQQWLYHLLCFTYTIWGFGTYLYCQGLSCQLRSYMLLFITLFTCKPLYFVLTVNFTFQFIVLAVRMILLMLKHTLLDLLIYVDVILDRPLPVYVFRILLRFVVSIKLHRLKSECLNLIGGPRSCWRAQVKKSAAHGYGYSALRLSMRAEVT